MLARGRQGDGVRAEKLPAAGTPPSARGAQPASVVIIGGGAAGLAAADMLRREGYDGPVHDDQRRHAPPFDRPNLSKDYLAGDAQEDWIPLRSPEFSREHRIELMLGSRVSVIDAAKRNVVLGGGSAGRSARS